MPTSNFVARPTRRGEIDRRCRTFGLEVDSLACFLCSLARRPIAHRHNMGLGMHGTGAWEDHQRHLINGNLKGDCKVKQFCVAAGLDVQGFPEYLLSLVAQGHELGGISNEAWNQILGPMDLPRERVAGVHKAISDVRMKANAESEELDRMRMHNHVVNGGHHPMSRPGAEVYEPTLNGSRPKALELTTARRR